MPAIVAANPQAPVYRNKKVRDPLSPRLFRTQRPSHPEDLWQPLYDRVNFPNAGTSELGFFSQPLGSIARLITDTAAANKTKTLRDTNMQNANVVPTKLFRFEGISMAYLHMTPDTITNSLDRELLRNGGYLKFRIVDKDILIIPLVAIPELNPMLSSATTVTSTTINNYAGGGGRIAMYKLPIPIVLNPYESFQVTISFDGTIAMSGSEEIDVLVMLQGYMRRPT